MGPPHVEPGRVRVDVVEECSLVDNGRVLAAFPGGVQDVEERWARLIIASGHAVIVEE